MTVQMHASGAGSTAAARVGTFQEAASIPQPADALADAAAKPERLSCGAAVARALEQLQSVAPRATARDEREKIQSLAIEVLRDYDHGRAPDEAVRRWAHRQLRRTGQQHPPFDVLKVAASMGAAVYHVPLESNGRVLIKGDQAIVFLNTHAQPEEQRFTLCHELAHVFFRRAAESVLADRPDRLRAVNEWGNSEHQERLCDIGAAELLTPLAHFRAACRETNARGIILGEHLAERFQCSLTVALRRLVKLGCRVIVTEWSLRERPGSTVKLRTDWSLSPLGRTIYVPIHKPTNHGPVADALHADDAQSARMVVEIRGLRRGSYIVQAKQVAEGRVVSVVDLESFQPAEEDKLHPVLGLL
jgi:Zn-dependent peptidase ImmA (M78 family)